MLKTRKPTHSRKKPFSRRNTPHKRTQKQTSSHPTISLKPLSRLTSNEIDQLAGITGDIETMKYIGRGNLWSRADILEYQKEDKRELSLPHNKKKHYSYVMLDSGKVIGFIEGRKNANLLRLKSCGLSHGPYDILMRTFIDRNMTGRGYGKMINKLFIKEYKRLIHKKRAVLYADIAPDNLASIKIHLANGYLFCGTVKYPNGKVYNRYHLLVT